MAKIRRNEKREMPALNTSSLPDIIFMFRKQYGAETRIQLNDQFAEVKEIGEYIVNERSSMKESDQGLMTVSIKADKETKMGVIADIKQELRRAYALKISYAATQRTSY